ncbi:MAG TPA: FtsX-like permease family protein [Candidatus Polarisedimenticolia bacterium]|jgi:putative ABC transport system permease protein|nr:FtsX-like permease family protein [Candidatus Polarisedimenticolia bacterium]
MLLLRLAFRNVFRNRVRTAIALLAIGVGCAALIVNGGVIYNIFEELREDAIYGRHAHLQIYRRGYSDNHLKDPGAYLIPRQEAERVLALVRALPHVARVTRQREFSGMISAGDRYVSFVGIGVDPAQDAEFSRHAVLRRGEPLSPQEPYGMLCGLGLAERFSGEPGRVVTLMTNTESGALNAVDVKLRGIFEGGMKAYDDWTLKLPLQAVEELLLDDRTEKILVLLDRTESVPEVQRAMGDLLRTQGLDLETRSWRDLALFHNQVVGLFKRELDVIKLIIATIVVLGIANTIGMSILERRVELATLRALGIRRAAIARLLFTEALLTGLIGGLLGVVLGCAIAWLVSAIGITFPSPPGSTRPFVGGVDVVPGMVLFAFVLSLGATLAAAILPIWKARRWSIAQVLRGA